VTYQASATPEGHGRSTQVSPAQNGRRTRYVQKPESVNVVISCCSREEYAQRTAKRDEVKGYYVPGYLAA
jgi:regulator of extracellular matrix RemA (YlzA/DUF370 family)